MNMKALRISLTALLLISTISILHCNRTSKETLPEGYCQADSDCTSSNQPFCHIGVCVACVQDTDCSCHQYCDATKECKYFADRGQLDSLSSAKYFCKPYDRCSGNEECCPAGTFCHTYTGQCLDVSAFPTDCNSDQLECPGGLVCDLFQERCVPKPNCHSDYNCCSIGTDYSTPAMQCGQTGKCDAYQIVCDPPEGIDTSCPFTPKDYSQCGAPLFCVYPGICVQCTCNEDCGPNLICNQATGRCMAPDQCAIPSDCPDPDEECNPNTGQCVAHCDQDEECAIDEFCNLSLNICVYNVDRPCDNDEYEGNGGNNILENASSLAPDTTQVAEAVKCNNEVDWFKLPLEKNDLVRIIIDHVDGQGDDVIYLQAFLPDGLTSRGITNSGFDNIPLEFVANENANHYLKVYSQDPRAQSAYTISITYDIGEACEDQVEDSLGYNNLPEYATALTDGYTDCTSSPLYGDGMQYNCSSKSLMACAGDMDFYSFYVPAGFLVEASIFDYVQNMDLSLYGPFSALAFNEQALADMSTNNDPSEQVSFVARPGGYFYLMAKPQGLTETAYNLTVNIHDASSEYQCLEDSYDSISYNDTLVLSDNENMPLLASRDLLNASSYKIADKDALSDAVYQQSATLTMCYGDQDSYRLHVDNQGSMEPIPAGYKVRASLHSVSNEAWAALVLFSYHNGSYTMVDGDVDSVSPSRTVLIDITDGHEYILAVIGQKQHTPFSYQLDTKVIPPPACAADNLETEFTNNQPALATSLPLQSDSWDGSTAGFGEYQMLSLCVDDSDWFSIQPPAGTRAVVQLEYADNDSSVLLAAYGQQVLEDPLTEAPEEWAGYLGHAKEQGIGFKRVRLAPPETQDTIYFMVRNTSGWPLPAYTLKVRYETMQCVEDSFYNNSNFSLSPLLTLTPIADADYNLSQTFLPQLSLCGAGPVSDWFSVYARPGDTIRAQMFYNPASGIHDLYLRKPYSGIGTPSVAQADFGDIPATGQLEVAYTVSGSDPEGEWFVQVRYSNLSEADSLYSLAVQKTQWCLEDNLASPVVPNIDDAQSDQGELLYRGNDYAIHLPTGLVADGNTDMHGHNASLCADEDWLSITLPAGEHVTICTQFDNSAGDIDLHLFDTYFDGIQHLPATAAPLAESKTKNDYEHISYQNTSGTEQTVFINVSFDPRDLALNPSLKNVYRLAIYGSSGFTCPIP